MNGERRAIGAATSLSLAVICACLLASLAMGGGLALAPSADAAEPGGISGTVTASATKEVVAGIEVCAFQSTAPFGEGCKTTNESGEYAISELPAGSYSVSFFAPEGSGLNYLAQNYPQEVSVASGTITPHIDAALNSGAEVTGLVVAEGSKAGIGGIEVCASSLGELEGLFGACAKTNGSGEYTLRGLASGEYKVSFFPPYRSGLNYIGQYYIGKSSDGEATVLSLTAGATTKDINATLPPGGEVSGRAISVSSKAAIAGLEVCAIPIAGELGNCAVTDASGAYTVPGLPSGNYRIQFAPPFEGELNYLTQYYNGKTSEGEADPVSVTAGAVTPNIDASMQAGGEIRGLVTGAPSKTPLEQVRACAAGPASRCGVTNASGEYVIAGLPSGSYTVSFSGPGEYAPQYYKEKVYASEAQSVTVVAGTTTSGVGAELQPGGKITGIVTSLATSLPLEGISVCRHAVKEESFGFCTSTNAKGEYTLAGLPATEYKLAFSTSIGNYLTQYYHGKGSLAEAEPVGVAADETKSGINAAMRVGGQISGTVTNAASKMPVSGAAVTAYTTGDSYVTNTSTNAKGEYTLPGLTTGSYTVGFNASTQDLVPQYYEDKSTLGEATSVGVTTGTTTEGINASLQVGGSIAGTVTNATTKAPLTGTDVEVATTSGDFVAFTTTNGGGEYKVSGLKEGSYEVSFSAYGFENQYYNGKSNFPEATPVSVVVGKVAESISAALQSLGSISGKVTDATSDAAVAGVEVCDYSESGEFTSCTSTDAGGKYTFTGLAAGSYAIGFFPGESDYLGQYYNDKPTLSEATKISVTHGGTVTGVNAALVAGGQVKGTVTSEASGLPLAGVEVCVQPTNESLGESCAYTTADGSYDVGLLQTGSYRVEFVPSEGSNYLLQFFEGKAKRSEATLLAVTTGAASEGINAALIEGGTIEGTINSVGTKAPLRHAEACAYSSEVETYHCADTNSKGEYKITGLPTAEYVVYFFPTEGEYTYQYYKEATTEAEATKMAVTKGSTATSIDGQLHAAGRITGTITGAATSKPLSGIEACAFSTTETLEECTTSSPSGEYTLAGLAPGKHKVEFRTSSQNYETQWFSGKAAGGEATLVGVSEEATTAEINAAMVEPGQITGRVTKEDGTTALSGILVCAYDTGAPYTGRCGNTTASGEYTLADLPRGSFKVSFYAPAGLNYIQQYYSDKASYEEAGGVTVTPGTVTANVSATMKAGGEVSGKVTLTKTTTGIAGIEVCPYFVGTGGTVVGCATTNSSGEYLIEKLPTGEYRVGFSDPFNSSLNYVHQYYSTRAHLAEGQKLMITAGATTTGINAALEPGGEVSGKVIRIGTKAPLQGIEVCASEHSGFESVGPCVLTNSSGEYTLRGLPPGLVNVEFFSNEYVQQCYNGSNDCEFPTGVPVEVLHVTTGINAALKSTHPIVPEATSAPTITGTPQQGSPLTEHHASWTNEPIEYRYQWLSCNSLGMGCLPIKDAESQSYTPLAQDVGTRLEVQETGINVEGESEPATSEPTAVMTPAKPVNQAPPAIKGEDRAGQTLTESHGSWTNEPSSYTYQWERCDVHGENCVFPANSTEQTYKLTSGDVGKTIRVIETAINAGGESEPAVSPQSAVAVVVPEVPTKLSPPSISGSAVQGDVLNESHGNWTNEPTNYSYKWERCSSAGTECSPIAEAVGSTYKLTRADIGHKLVVAETASNAGGHSKPAVSGPTALVAGAVPARLSPPTISGQAKEAGLLTEAHGSWTNEPTAFTYQWERCTAAGKECKPILGATEETYTPVEDDVGHKLAVEEVADNETGPGVGATSEPTAVVVTTVPVDITPPTISGTARQGETLKELHGSWTNQPTAYEIQWQRCDQHGENCSTVAIGSENSEYLLSAEDLGHTIRVLEIASNGGGPGEPASSAPTARVVAGVPGNISPPKISGHAVQAETLTEAHGSWTNEPSTYTYQWERCTTAGSECQPIGGATEQTYVLTTEDVAHKLVVAETAHNAGGDSNPEASAPTAVVDPPIPVNKAAPKIAGLARVGSTLTEEHGSWTNSPTRYTYQWERCNTLGLSCLPIQDATQQTYTIEAADLGSTLVVVETASNSAGPGTPAISDGVGPVTLPPPVNTAPPEISGPPESGQTLVISHGSWTNSPHEYREQWLRCGSGGESCAPIHDAINLPYVPTAADVGHTLRAQEVASNGGGQSEPAQSAATAMIAAAPLRANAGEDIEAATDVPVAFDGSGSTPSNEITGYHWEFGDGTSGEGQIAHHAYTTAGTYTATLTVQRGGEASKQSITVAVTPPSRQITVTALDESEHSLEGVEMLYVGPSGTRTEAMTDASGQATLAKLPDGTDTVYLFKEGYKPAVGHVSVSGGIGEATVTLTSGALGEAKLKSKEMTKAEIEAAGINVNEPGNSTVYEFEVKLKFGQLVCHVNGEGEFVGLEDCTGGGGGSGGGVGWTPRGICAEEVCVAAQAIKGHPIIETLKLDGKASALKQFFAVSMIVSNPSPEPFKFTHGQATLTVPAGMSLAPTPTPQAATQNVADVPGEGSAEVNWILRGDAPGEYYLSAAYHGQLEPFEAPFELQAATDEPLKVWGAEALGFHVQADSGSLQGGVPYHVKIGIVNNATIPLYNVAVEVNGADHDHFIYQPGQQFTAIAGELKPGETVYAPQDILVPDANSAGAFEPEQSSAHFAGETVHPGEGIEQVSPPPLYTMSAVLESSTMVHLHWQPSPGADGYEVFSTPNLDTPFAASPDAVQTSPTSKTTLTRLPATTTDAYIPRGATDPPRFYALATMTGGQLRLEHPVREPLIQGPTGGPLTLRELLAGGNNPAEFCLQCAMNRIMHGDPVDAPTGNFWHSFTDIVVPGRGLPLNLTRTYNSGAATTNGPFGYGWSFPYGLALTFPDTEHVVVNQENGSQVTFTEQPDKTYAAAPRVTATLVHNEDGSWTFLRRHRETFAFDSAGQLTQEKDLNGYVTSLAYDAQGQLSTVTDAAGRKLTFKYSKGHIISVTDPLKRVVRYAYDSAGNLTDVTDVSKGDTHFTYDSAHRMLTMRMPNQAPGVPGSTGAVVTNTYDEQGRVTAQTDQLGRTTTFKYVGEPLGEEGGTTTITDPKGNVTVQEYKFGELMSETKGFGTPQAATWKFGYDPNTLGLTTVTDPDGHTTTSNYDSEGNTLTTTDPLGRTTTNTYDGLNDPLTTTDPLGVTTTNTYNARGNLLTTSRPLTGTSQTQTTTYVYEDAAHPGDVTAIKDPDGDVTHNTYDAYGDLTSTTDALGDKTTTTYNIIGWPLSVVPPRGNVKGANPASFGPRYSYNNFGQVTRTSEPTGITTTTKYDPDQNLIATTDGDGNTTSYSYDAADERTATHRANGTTTQTTYWPDGSVKEQIDAAGHVTLYEYDPLGRQSAVTDPLGRVTHYEYDGAGNQIAVTDPEGQVTSKTYDAANELTSISYSDKKTPNVSNITYDADGERTSMTDGTGTSSWTWDSLHRLASMTNGAGKTVSYQYDLRGLPTEITYPGGQAITREYDAAGRLSTVKDWLGNTTTFTYDPDGNLTKELLPAATKVVDTFAYDNDDQLNSIIDRTGTKAFFSANYGHDKNGQLSSDSSLPKPVHSYKYTPLNQLCYAGSSSTSACASPPAGSQPYAYDSADNLTTNNGTTQQFDAANQLCWTVSGASSNNCATPPTGATTYTYDERGNRTGSVAAGNIGTCDEYDQANRLTAITTGTGSSCTGPTTVATYAYSGSGLRQSKTVRGTTTQFAWDESAELPLLLQEKAGSANPTSYIYGPGELPLEQIDSGGKVHYYHHDQLGSTRAITSMTGAVDASYAYNPYGKITASTNAGAITNALLFDGQYTDAETGYQYLRARYYDPSTGEFLSSDPLAEVTLEPFSYASNDPLDGVDPSGLRVNLWSVAKYVGVAVGITADVLCDAVSDGACLALQAVAAGAGVASTGHDCATGGKSSCVQSGVCDVAGVATHGVTDPICAVNNSGDTGGNGRTVPGAPPCTNDLNPPAGTYKQSSSPDGFIDPTKGTYSPSKEQQFSLTDPGGSP